MTVFILEKVPVGLRGQLTRWMLEVKAGVFVGTLSQRVRELLWERATKRKRRGSVVMIYADRNEQGFSMRSDGEPSRQLIDMDGLTLVLNPKS